MASGDLTATNRTFSEAAALFQTHNKRHAISNNTETYAANESFTACAWVKLTKTNNNYGAIVSPSSWGFATWALFIGQPGLDNVPAGYFGVGGFINSPAAISVNEWHHLALTFDGTTATFFVDGTATIDGNRGHAGITNQITLGRFYNDHDDYYVDGCCKDIRIYDRALSTQEVGLVKNGDLTISGLKHRYPLISDFQDTQGNHATASNSYILSTNSLKVRAGADASNLPAATDKLIIVPTCGRNYCFKVLGVAREA